MCTFLYRGYFDHLLLQVMLIVGSDKTHYVKRASLVSKIAR